MALASKQTSEAALGRQTASTWQHWLMVSCFRMECKGPSWTDICPSTVSWTPRSSYYRMSTANGFGIRSNVEGREICCQHRERSANDEVVMAASRLQSELRQSSNDRTGVRSTGRSSPPHGGANRNFKVPEIVLDLIAFARC